MIELLIDNFIPKNLLNQKITITPFIFLSNLRSSLKKGTLISSGNTELKCNTNHNDVEELFVNNLNLIKINKNVFINLSNLTQINFSNNGLIKISKKFILLTNLKILNLDNNQILSLPNYVFEIANLEVLSINNNLIKYIPTSIQFLKKLKIFQISYNKVSSLPIEFGLLKSLEILYIDNNNFTEIPSTLCYLKNLREIKLEWFEFLDPPLPKTQIDPTFLQTFKNSFQDLISRSQLFCDFSNFVLKLSPNIQNKITEQSNKNYNNTFDTEKDESNVSQCTKIFTAVNNNYIGVTKSLIFSNETNLKIKNKDNKTPLYLSIQQTKTEISDMLLSKMEFKNAPSSYTYLHKAIRGRNFNLVVKLYQMGLDFNSLDEKGNNCYHVLFSFFNKSFDKCCQIGNFLIEKNISGINKFNFDKWSPIHLAARYSSCECLNWIKNQNLLLKNQKREIININIKGKNNWTPLHLALSAYRYSESALLIHLGSDLFSKTYDGRRPKKVTNNYFLTKMVTSKEIDFYLNKYFFHSKKKENRLEKLKIEFGVRNHQIKDQEDLNYSFESIEMITETLLNSEVDISRKMKSLSILKINYSSKKIESVVAELLEQIDINNFRNYILISEICEIIITYNLKNIIPILKQAQSTLVKKNSFVYYQLKHTFEFIQVVDIQKNDKFYNQKIYYTESNYHTQDNIEDNNSSRTEKNYLMYFEDDEDTIKIDRDFFSEMNQTLFDKSDKFNQKYNTINSRTVKMINSDSDKVRLIEDEQDCLSDSIIIQQDEDEIIHNV